MPLDVQTRVVLADAHVSPGQSAIIAFSRATSLSHCESAPNTTSVPTVTHRIEPARVVVTVVVALDVALDVADVVADDVAELVTDEVCDEVCDEVTVDVAVEVADDVTVDVTVVLGDVRFPLTKSSPWNALRADSRKAVESEHSPATGEKRYPSPVHPRVLVK